MKQFFPAYKSQHFQYGIDPTALREELEAAGFIALEAIDTDGDNVSFTLTDDAPANAGGIIAAAIAAHTPKRNLEPIGATRHK